MTSTVQIVKLVNFGRSRSGLTTVGYTILNSAGSIVTPRTTAGVYEVSGSTGIYGALATFSASFVGTIAWDSGQQGTRNVYAAEHYNYLENNPDSNDIWNASSSLFNTPGTFGAVLNEVLGGIRFHVSATFVASGTITGGDFSHISTSLNANINQFNGMLLLLKSVASGNQTRIIDSFQTGVFDVEPPFTFAAVGDSIFVMSTQFSPTYGSTG